MKDYQNVVIACDYAYVDGGGAKVAIQTAIALSKYTKKNIYYLGGSGEPCRELMESKVHLHCLKKPDLLSNPSKFNALHTGVFNSDIYDAVRSLLEKLGSQQTILHVHTWTKVLTSAVFKAANELGVPIYITAHDYFLTCPNGGCYNYKNGQICELRPMSLKCCMCNCDSRGYIYKVWRCIRQMKQNSVIACINELDIICVSDFQENQLMKRSDIIRFKHTVIKNYIELKNRYRVNAENNDVFLFIGRITEQKGIEVFCEAVTGSKVNAVVIGDGELKNRLENIYPNIRFTGWLQTNDIREWVARTRCLVFPSIIYECAPLTISEVQAYGIPCIVSNVGAGVDYVVDGINGETVAPVKNEIMMSIERMKDDDYVRKLSINTYNQFDDNIASEKFYVNQLLEQYNSSIHK